MKEMKRLMQTALIFSLSFILSSCIFIAGAAAGAAAIAVVYDHRTISNTIQDTRIANKIFYKLSLVPGLHYESHVKVNVFHRIVLLTGETPDPNWRREAENFAKSVPGVIRVYNQVSIQGPTSTLTRTNDYWITAKIKAQMLGLPSLKSSSLKIITENGVVYLMGIVTTKQGEVAVDIARKVSGVQKVVKVFQYKN